MDLILRYNYPAHHIYIFALILIAISLPFSPFLLSISIILLLINWLIEGGLLSKISIALNNNALLIFLSLYLIHILGLLLTSDFDYAAKDMRIKFPLLIIPIVIATSKDLNAKELRLILLAFCISVILASFAIASFIFGFIDFPYSDSRNASLFISHVRYSLMMAMAIFILLYMYRISSSYKFKIGFLFFALWLIIFLFIFKALSGIVVFCIITIFFLIRYSKKFKSHHLNPALILLFILPILAVAYVLNVTREFYSIKEIDLKKLETRTLNGNEYINDTLDKQIENGHYVYIYVCELELRKEWTKRSTLHLDSLDKKQQSLKYTLIRYLSSKGLRKDSAGLSMLDPEEIIQIENGVTNHIYRNRISFYPKIYEVIWQIDRYNKIRNPSGQSVSLRFYYLQNAIQIIRKNFWFGTGTGDLISAYNEQYKTNKVQIEKRFWLRAHNQYITFFVAFGVFGFLLCLMALFLPIIITKRYRDYFFLIFFITAYLSMLNEDTLETHIGASFFAFFYALTMFGYKENILVKSKQNSEIS